ncbi:single-stranded DNA-binding protein [Candidatus Kaiserbacteria bacterium RIFCSPLOWO2_02_FULL_54_13]|uniref:Single-stranded DNA-binding protein n=1 Tax=Candidatus Kaiserbacteria bacterium RIFCSPHIGHO2_02_FULL_54_22 TaxID=1798495 RepID=A0A1F6DLR3_9BACT|nr:MAG: single-stranded DNA-binding protein [Candidatus Kaiserbacteria bacterium RIFCSPHIGHO2_02_FULL_54_22]OGG68272.1 MAG: single-stranded DNA-binding protein [Candidatus Kaiserbacteria bacterium RIFCSPHIGHO2_12_FULL_54_16]OGG83469.1 MAG: single-stranded DNA-binding protein [Candidatus Kaiserbacteria bacterium RIFCSPLOWO2_02_FULL_54_13]OGG89842.1 MAG: single-stranded DNA-binding protein [Candidatus Kaiserbacteria bacterium RIFCSPLOWO2_12_FULL_54_10]
MYLNKVFLYGNLTRDPELKALPSGSQVANFGIATNRTYKDKSGVKQEATEFHNIVAFGRTAEVIAQYMKKGRPIFVEGRIQTRSWEGKEDGKKQYRTEIVVDNFQFGADAKGPSTSSGQAARSEEQAAPSEGETIKYPDEEINPEDIPF